jgi:LmbE family N-acetylglucosaminyl deacetylase
MRVLAVVAHPDDETLGCGGWLARLADEGNAVRVFLPLRRSDPRGVAHWDELVESFLKACAVLDVEPVVGDPPMEEADADTDVRRLHSLVEPHVEEADVVLTHWYGDVHQVHRNVTRAVEIATRPFRRRRDVFLFEVPTSTDQSFEPAFRPQLHVVLQPEHVQRKVAAMACYRTEGAPGREPLDLERRAELRGAEIGVRYAEAFAVAREFR